MLDYFLVGEVLALSIEVVRKNSVLLIEEFPLKLFRFYAERKGEYETECQGGSDAMSALSGNDDC
jgi:hypothetical protein